jgi:hypothetical protein
MSSSTYRRVMSAQCVRLACTAVGEVAHASRAGRVVATIAESMRHGRAVAIACMAFVCMALAAAPAFAAERVSIIDISSASRAEVEQLKRLPKDAWWLEMGDRFVVVGDAASARIVASKARVVASRDNVDADYLMLRAQGCSEHSTERGSVLAEGGRWELRLVAPHEIGALKSEHAGAWVAVPRNATLARQYRLEAPARAAPADPAIQEVVERIDAARWFSDVSSLAGWDRSSYGTTDLIEARDWIRAQFDGLGLATTLLPFQMSSPGGTITRHNVIGTWTGATQPERWVIVGAHYDSRTQSISTISGTPGAEDNASGCAGVIELARALIPSQPARSIVFMCYAGEEQNLRGSAAHAQGLIQAGGMQSVDLVAIMDMIGYSADAELEALFESYGAYNDYLMRYGAAAATYVPELDVVFSTSPFGSDHMSYLRPTNPSTGLPDTTIGRPAVLSIENDWNSYPHYHRSTDTPANLGPHALGMGAAILKTNAAVIAELGGLAPAPAEPFRDGFEDTP